MSDSGQRIAAKADKPLIRADLLAARRQRSGPARAAAAARIQAVLTGLIADLPTSADGPMVAAYVPVGSEPGGPDLPAALARHLPPRGRLILPVLRPDLGLDWAVYQGLLRPGPKGTVEATGPRLGPAALTTADLVVVPALAVDRRGVRLGKGGGSYDRALAPVPPEVPVIALLHDGELRDRLPAEPHDRPVTAVVTPSAGLVRLPADPPEAPSRR